MQIATVILYLRIPAELRQAIEEHAAAERRTLSATARILIEEALAARAAGSVVKIGSEG